jgi:hypothetical protein
MSPAGYSGKPVSEKLGIKAQSELIVVSAPSNYSQLIAPIPEGVRFVEAVSSSTSGAHVFATSRELLSSELVRFREELSSSAYLWVSWPKKASKVETDITEDTIRELALPLGFVDVKVCAISEIWSGLKLVVRKELR